MAKFPSQNRIWYETPSVGTNATAVGHISLPKDLSILNRRGYASTTRKGVPLVYKCRVDYYVQDNSGEGLSAAVGTDFASTLHIEGCQNNWVMKNAAVKLHAAREKWLRSTGVSKRLRGAYAHEIRYNYDGASDSFLTPHDALGADFAGGTWDMTEFADDLDNSWQIKLVGNAVDESAATTANEFSLPGLYLNSRSNQHTDTNLEADDTPANYSHLQFMLGELAVDEQQDVAMQNIRDEQDNPPYDVWAVDDTQNDITEPVNLGIATATVGAGYGSCIVDAPFGIMDFSGRNHDAAGTSVTSTCTIVVTVLDIYPMQG